MRTLTTAVLLVLAVCSSVPSAYAGIIYTAGAGDGFATRDWWSGSYYWVDTTSATINSYHDGSSRWSNRGAVLINISSLAGQTLAPNTATFNFYSLGFSGTSLQYMASTGPTVTTGFATAGGTPFADLNIGEGWQSYNVTSLVQSSIDSAAQNIGFIFVAGNFNGGNLAASEDGQGRGAYLQITPEPATLALLASGGLGMLLRRRRK